MSFNFVHRLLVASAVAAGSVGLMIWCKYDSDNDAQLSKLDGRFQAMPNVINEPELLDSVSLDGARQLESVLTQDNSNEALAEIDSQSALLASAIQSESNRVESLVDLGETELVAPPTTDSVDLELATQMLNPSADEIELPPSTISQDSFGVDQNEDLLTAVKSNEPPANVSVAPIQNMLPQANAQTIKGWQTNPYVDLSKASVPSEAKQLPVAEVASVEEPLRPSAPAPQTQPPMVIQEAPQKSIPQDPVLTDDLVLPEGSVLSAMRNEPITPVQMGLSEPVAQQATHHIEYGKSLARRGAAFAARQEFFSALRVIAQANDAMSGGTDFSKALTQAIRAMKEAEDFRVQNSETGAYVDVAATVEAHQTKILTQREARDMSPVAAMQAYYGFANQQLDFASGRNVVSGEALHCLGKLHTVMARHKKTMPGNLDVAKAIVFHKASLTSNPVNPSSANELGVLLAKTGQLQQATSMFKQSLINQSSPQAWNNLAKAHHRLGETDMAQLAETELAMSAQGGGMTTATAGIQWVQNSAFNAMAPMEFEPRVASNQPVVEPVRTVEPEPAEETDKSKSFGERIKSWF